MNENKLAENLMYYRKKKGLSQEKVAEYMDVSRQAVTKWEADTSKPSSDHLIKLAQLFEVDVDFYRNICFMYTGIYNQQCFKRYF